MASGWVDWMCLVRDALLGASRSTILFGLVSTRKGLVARQMIQCNGGVCWISLC